MTVKFLKRQEQVSAGPSLNLGVSPPPQGNGVGENAAGEGVDLHQDTHVVEFVPKRLFNNLFSQSIEMYLVARGSEGLVRQFL